MTATVVMTTAAEAKARHNIGLLGTETNQQLSFRHQEVEAGQGSPLHLHNEQAEIFHVVRGEFKFQVDDKTVIGKPGFTVHIPKGVPHCFAFQGTEDSNTGYLISVLTPGIHDGFIQKVPDAQESGVGKKEVSALAEKFGAKILGPRISAKL